MLPAKQEFHLIFFFSMKTMFENNEGGKERHEIAEEIKRRAAGSCAAFNATSNEDLLMADVEASLC